METDLIEISQDKLKLESEISSPGSRNTVWKAIYSSPSGQKTVAVKNCARFKKDEALIMKELRHPNIIQFEGVTPILLSGYYIVTEYADKGSLYNLIKQHRDDWSDFRMVRWIKWAVEMARGLQYIHELNYQHGNVKSPNMVITRDDTLKVCDMDTARCCEFRVSADSIGASLAWMAPEAMCDPESSTKPTITSKSDVFSYAVVVWELITGKAPYTGETPFNILKAVAVDRERLEIPTECPEALRELLTECWDHDPTKRPSMAVILSRSKPALFFGEWLSLQSCQCSSGDSPSDKSGSIRNLMKGMTALLPRKHKSYNIAKSFQRRSAEQDENGMTTNETKTDDSESSPEQDVKEACDRHSNISLTQPCPTEPATNYDVGKEDWEIPRTSFTLDKMIADGQFGEVWKGFWKEAVPVAIKTPKAGVDPSGILAETDIMKKLRHPNISQLCGVCSDKEPIYVVTEWMCKGNLLNYLREGEGRDLKLPELIDFATQIACGMSHLETMNIIHRQLAARTVLVGDANTAKIGDFGLAVVSTKLVEPARDQLRTKWTAPEALLHGCFSIKSDVWSFGILLTELVTYGRPPYPSLTISEVGDLVEHGYRMPQMSNCPDALYKLMNKCWHPDPQSRYTFEFLYYYLDNFFVVAAETVFQ